MVFKQKKVGRRVDPKDFMSQLVELFAAANGKGEIQQLLQAILTPDELEQIKLRWQIVQLLLENYPQRKVAQMLGISTSKVGRGSREIKFGNGIFQKLFARICEEK